MHVAIAGAVAKSITCRARVGHAQLEPADVAVLPRAVTEHNARAGLQAMPSVKPVQGGWAASVTWQF